MMTAVQIFFLSVAVAMYDIWAFHGWSPEYPRDGGGMILGLLLSILSATTIAVLIYKRNPNTSKAELRRFAMRCWFIVAGIASFGIIVLYFDDPSAFGQFDDNFLLGAAGLVALVIILKFALNVLIEYLAPKRP